MARILSTSYVHVHVHTRTVNVCAMLMISYVILKYAPYDWLKCNPRLQKKKSHPGGIWTNQKLRLICQGPGRSRHDRARAPAAVSVTTLNLHLMLCCLYVRAVRNTTLFFPIFAKLPVPPQKKNMPALPRNPSSMTKERLAEELKRNNIPLPRGRSKKEVYVELYQKHLLEVEGEASPQWTAYRNMSVNTSPTFLGFSSDEEDGVLVKQIRKPAWNTNNNRIQVRDDGDSVACIFHL